MRSGNETVRRSRVCDVPSLCWEPFIVKRCSWEGWNVNFYCHKDDLLFIHQGRQREAERIGVALCVCAHKYMSLDGERAQVSASIPACMPTWAEWKEIKSNSVWLPDTENPNNCLEFICERIMLKCHPLTYLCVHMETRLPWCIFRRPHISDFPYSPHNYLSSTLLPMSSRYSQLPCFTCLPLLGLFIIYRNLWHHLPLQSLAHLSHSSSHLVCQTLRSLWAVK